MEFDIIIGIHSIAEALKNSQRKHLELVGTAQGFAELKDREGINRKDLNFPVEQVNSHQLQEKAKKSYLEQGFSYQRIPSQVYLKTSPLPEEDLTWVYSELESGKATKNNLFGSSY